MGRSPCCDKSKVKRGTWSPEEDAILNNYLQNHGSGNWITLPNKAGLKRCGKSCRLRWLNYLRPDIKRGGFTEDEEYIICNLYNKIGSRWSVITSHLPGRTDNDVKNYWNTKLKKKLMATKSDVATAAASTAAATVASTASRIVPPGIVANVPINFGPSRLILEGSSDCSSGGNVMNFPFCPSQFQQDPSPFWSFSLGMEGSNELKVDEFSWEILSGIWPQEEVIGADLDADLFSILHFDSKPHD